MGRGTWLVIGAVAAIALVAAFDSLRGGDETPASTPGTTTEQTTTEAEPAASEPGAGPAAFGGVLYYTDENCELRAGRLPALESIEAPGWDECHFVLSPDGTRASGAGSGWDPHSDPRIGRLFEVAGGRIQISSNLGPEGEPIRGTAPAWRPNGRLTYVAGGALREWPRGGVVLSQNDLAVAVRAHPGVPDSGRVRGVAVEETAWLDDDRVVASLSVPVEDSVEHLVAVFAGRRLEWVEFAGPRTLSDLRVSPAGRFFAVMAGSSFLLFDSRRGLIETPTQIDSDIHALTWSPDEQWVAAAAGQSVYVFRPGDVARAQVLSIVASDLAWRGTAEPPPLTNAAEARDWLGGVRATGRLFVTMPGCRLRALRLPDLVWEEQPAGDRAPCRFALDVTDQAVAESISVAPGGKLRATCRDGSLAVFGDAGPTVDISDACGPAWMPDGTLTFIRDGELWQGTVGPRRVITRTELRDVLGREAALEEVAWLDDRRLWAVVRSGPNATIALLGIGDLALLPSHTARRIEGLQVSATGMASALTERGVVIFDTGGRRALSFLNGTAVAWAPGELVAAVATPTEILFVAPISREVVSVPLGVEDLEWVVP